MFFCFGSFQVGFLCLCLNFYFFQLCCVLVWMYSVYFELFLRFQACFQACCVSFLQIFYLLIPNCFLFLHRASISSLFLVAYPLMILA